MSYTQQLNQVVASNQRCVSVGNVGNGDVRFRWSVLNQSVLSPSSLTEHGNVELSKPV